MLLLWQWVVVEVLLVLLWLMLWLVGWLVVVVVVVVVVIVVGGAVLLLLVVVVVVVGVVVVNVAGVCLCVCWFVRSFVCLLGGVLGVVDCVVCAIRSPEGL